MDENSKMQQSVELLNDHLSMTTNLFEEIMNKLQKIEQHLENNNFQELSLIVPSTEGE